MIAVRDQRLSKRGFTLVELLAVIAMISVVAGMYGYTLLSSGSGSMDGAQRIAALQFVAARQRAALGNTEARVIINNDPDDAAGYLREFGVIVNVADPGATPEWVAATQGEKLPKGFYFVPEVAFADGSRRPEEMIFTFPSTQPEQAGNGVPYYYFEFNAKGFAEDPGFQLVLEPGRLEPAGSGFEVVPQNPDARAQRESWAGFMVLRLGGLLFFPSAEAIQS